MNYLLVYFDASMYVMYQAGDNCVRLVYEYGGSVDRQTGWKNLQEIVEECTMGSWIYTKHVFGRSMEDLLFMMELIS